MTTEPDPAETVPTDNSAGTPADDRQLGQLQESAGEQDPEAALEDTPGPAGRDPVVGGLAED